MAALTSGLDQMLRFELVDWEGDFKYATYDEFSIADNSKLYSLNVSKYNGTAGLYNFNTRLTSQSISVDHEMLRN